MRTRPTWACAVSAPPWLEAFEQAALAMTAVISDPAAVEPRDRITIDCEAADKELLLAEWLNSLVFEMATRSMLFSRFAIGQVNR